MARDRKDETPAAVPAPRVVEGKLEAQGLSFAIVASRFNHFIVDRLVEGALDALGRHGADPARITVVRVPGSFEIPLAAKKLAATHDYDAVICLGAVIRGDTPHFDFIASEAAKGVASVSMQTGLPVIFGVITADTLEQAIERAGIKGGNKGRDAALNAIEMANLFDCL